jgi:protein O-mannosyl-transferase
MDSARHNKQDCFNLLLLILLAGVTVTAYHRVLFNFFAGDDYCHLAWLAAASKDPRLLWANFTGPWLGGVVTHFYRPMISIITLADYFCWKDNATGYHVTNLAGLLGASLFLFFIFDSISKLTKLEAGRFWAVAAAGLFALYPLHPEAVSWIIGRVDVISTFFYTAALCFYIWWRTSKRRVHFIVALSATVLGLLSKEMVVTLPGVMFAFDLLFGDIADGTLVTTRGTARLSGLLLRAVKNTAPFWLLLAGYAVIRRLALGTFVGGYDASWSFVASPQLILQTWLHSLHALLVPVNHDFMGARDWHTRLWELFVTVSAVSLSIAVCINTSARRLFLFLLLWLVAALVPLYNIFAIGSELQGGRFGYLPSCALSGILLLGYFSVNAGKLGSVLLRLCVPCFLLLSANILYINNEAWHSDGVELAAIEKGLSKELTGLPTDCQVLLLNLPDSVHGAYACRNAADGILFRVGAKIDPNRCLAISRFQNSFPCGFLKDSMAANANKIMFLWWSPEAQKFVRINPTGQPAQSMQLQSPTGESFKPVPASGVSYKQLADGSLYVTSTIRGVRPRIDIKTLTGRSCWNVDFVNMQIQVLPGGNIGGPCGCDLIYANTSNPKLGDLHYRAHVLLKGQSAQQSVLFALRGDEAWTFGGKILGCAILLPDQCRLIIKKVSVVPPYSVMPRLSFANGDFFHSKGYVGLNQDHAQQELQFDATGIADARKTILELSRRNVFFEYANPASASNTVGRLLMLPGLKGHATLNLSQFPEPGYYSLRIRAIDGNGKNVGLASDQIIIQVSH